MKIIVYPGSFDPIHNGHLLIARHAKRAIGADLVLFLLSPSTVWKKVQTSFNHRANMINAALTEAWFTLSRIEEGNEGKLNYTYITMICLKEMYPDDELFLLLGEDQAMSFDQWKHPELIVERARILVYKRKGSKVSNENFERFNMLEITGPLSETSSTKVRNFESIDVPSAVLDYIGANKLYFTGLVAKRMSDERYYHSLSVASLSRLIAIANDVDPLKAYKAGLFHDIGKEVPEGKSLEIMNKHFPKYVSMPLWAHHQFVGAYLMKEEYLQKDKALVAAVKYHATGNKKMSKLGKVIYAADKIEPSRGFDSREYIAECIKDIDQGFVIVLQANKDYLTSKGKDIDNPLTNACFKSYLK
ncbi:MAG: putative nicotinate-nucleotide adenylyltransferase [Tenericutes bacterium ADurb.Bin087]|nr:MAG: putative nicotinate-nucleotide adenylyltransferase [Tenericutes bacterium ADurb.Bin087]